MSHTYEEGGEGPSHSARSTYSGAIDGRPEAEYRRSKLPFNDQNCIRQLANLAQRMILGNTLLQRHTTEDLVLDTLVFTHTAETIESEDQTKTRSYFNKFLERLTYRCWSQNADAKQSSFAITEVSQSDLMIGSCRELLALYLGSAGTLQWFEVLSFRNKHWKLGHSQRPRGEKLYGVLDLPVQGETYRLPMWLINGDEAGPTLVVTGGVHGAEYASIAAALELGRSLEPRGLRGRVVVVPVLNLPGFAARSIYVCPLDGKNPNRVFPGDEGGTGSEQMADWVFRNVISRADYYVDLHGGDLIEALVPFTIFFRSGKEQVDAVSLEMAKIFGLHYLVASESPGSTICAASRAGIPSILTESGGQGIWTAEHVADHINGLERLMRYLQMIPGSAPEPTPFTLLQQFLWLRSEHEGFWYPGVRVGENVHAGQALGFVKDWEGNVLQTGYSPGDGTVLFIVSSLAIHQNEPLFAVGA